MEATSDGRIRIHAKSVRGFGLPIKPLMKLFSVEMDDMLKVEPGHGVWVDDNDLILDPQLMLPPPHIRGKVTEVHVEGDTLVQTLGTGTPTRSNRPPSPRTTSTGAEAPSSSASSPWRNTDLELIDMDPKDPFDFSARRWNDQLVAGFSKNTPNRGLKAHMPDFNDLAPPRFAPALIRPRLGVGLQCPTNRALLSFLPFRLPERVPDLSQGPDRTC